MKTFWSIVILIELCILAGWPLRYLLTADNNNAKGMASALTIASVAAFVVFDIIVFALIKFFK